MADTGSPIKAQPAASKAAAPVPTVPDPKAQASTSAPAAAAEKTPAAPAPTQAQLDAKYEVVEDGKKVIRTGKELVDAYQLRQLSDRKRAEADKIERNFATIQELAKNDPIKFLRHLGVDVDNLTLSHAAQIAEQKMEEQTNPEGYKAKKLAEENEQYKAYIQRQKEEQEKVAQQAELQAEWKNINTEIVDALKEQVALGYEVDEETIMQIALRMQLQDSKKKPVSAKEAIPHVFEADKKRIQKITKPMSGEQLLSLFGEDTYKKVLKHALQKEKLKKQESLKKDLEEHDKPSSYVVPKEPKDAFAPKWRSFDDLKKNNFKK